MYNNPNTTLDIMVLYDYVIQKEELHARQKTFF